MSAEPSLVQQITDRLERLLDIIEAEDGLVSFHCTRAGWSIACEFGHEAPGSPMAGGAVYGEGPTLTAALDQALEQL